MPAVSGRRFASVLLLDSRGWLLLQERDEHPAIDPERWGLPGGHVEPGEGFAAAARRELAEETGIELPAGSLRLWCEVLVDHRDVHGSWDTVQVFAAATALTDADVECHEGRQMVFVAPGRARRLELTRSARVVVPAFLDSPNYASMAP